MRSAWEADHYYYSDGPERAVAAVLDEFGAPSLAATPGVVDERRGKPRSFSRRPWECMMLGN